MTTAATERKADPGTKTILVADDEKSICALFEAILKREGFKVAIANDGQTALDRLRSKAPQKIDLVILDLMMPGPGGYEVLRELQHPNYQGVPVLVATSRDLDELAEDMIRVESNVCGIWHKPFDRNKFRRNLHLLLGTEPLSA
jgi:CheY-like chemotaxis protein